MLKEINEIYPNLVSKYAKIACDFCYIHSNGVCEHPSDIRPCVLCYSYAEKLVEDDVISYINSLEG